MRTRKFMQTLDTGTYRELSLVAKKRGINLQTLIRAVIIPFWQDRQDRMIMLSTPFSKKNRFKIWDELPRRRF